jgi:hypothetical protein
MAECSVLTASSKARMSSCSASLSRWDSPITASLCGLVRGHDRPGRLDAQTPRGLPVGTPGARHQETRLAAAKRTAGRWPIISSGILSAARPRRSAGRRVTSWRPPAAGRPGQPAGPGPGPAANAPAGGDDSWCRGIHDGSHGAVVRSPPAVVGRRLGVPHRQAPLYARRCRWLGSSTSSWATRPADGPDGIRPAPSGPTTGTPPQRWPPASWPRLRSASTRPSAALLLTASTLLRGGHRIEYRHRSYRPANDLPAAAFDRTARSTIHQRAFRIRKLVPGDGQACWKAHERVQYLNLGAPAHSMCTSAGNLCLVRPANRVSRPSLSGR